MATNKDSSAYAGGAANVRSRDLYAKWSLSKPCTWQCRFQGSSRAFSYSNRPTIHLRPYPFYYRPCCLLISPVLLLTLMLCINASTARKLVRAELSRGIWSRFRPRVSANFSPHQCFKANLEKISYLGEEENRQNQEPKRQVISVLCLHNINSSH